MKKKNSQDMTNEIKLDDPPEQLISAVNFMPSSNHNLLVSSWDYSVRMYDIERNTMVLKYCHSAPVLDCCFQDQSTVWSGGVDGQVISYDMEQCSKTVIGLHDTTVKCISHCPEANTMISGGWDAMIKMWDTRTNTSVNSIKQPAKVYTMDVCGSNLIVGTAGRRIIGFDLRKTGEVLFHRESSLKFQTRCIRAFPNKTGYVVSSIEGRVAVEYLDPSPEIQKKKFAFKCHRIKEGGVEYIYPVNAIAFHHKYNTFATGGSDGYVNIWDGTHKRRLCQFHRYPTHISSLSFSSEGNMLAIASSLIYEHDSKSTKTDAIYIKTLTDRETKPGTSSVS